MRSIDLGLRASRGALFALAILCVLVAIVVRAEPGAARPLTEAEKARMALDRLGFGARPGDVERVQAIGVMAWIDRQLQPASIPDAALAARLEGLTVPRASTAELYRKYPNPTAIRQQVLRSEPGGNLRRNVARNAGREEAAMGDAMENPSAANSRDDAADRSKMRQAIAQVYRDQGFGRPREVYLQLAADRLLRATYSERQLQEVMVDFWSNHFNIYARKNISQWFLPAYDRETIRPHAMGKFRDLLLATAQSPAMLFYLDNFESVSPSADLVGKVDASRRDISKLSDEQLRNAMMRRRGLSAQEADERIRRLRANPDPQRAQRLPNGINENYARELMELHTLGVDGGYSQQDIKEVARCFTGWSILDPRGYAVYAGISDDARLQQRLQRQRSRFGLPEHGESGSFYFNAKLHDPGPKTVLGRRIDAGGMQDGTMVIDLLARHPATARYIANKLTVKFVSDNPSPALVARVAAAFTNSDGDIRSTLRALFHDPEFFAPANYRAKIKTPFELVVSSLRALQADSNGRDVQALLADLGEPLYGYQAPTGYPDTAADWVNSGALLKRMNFAVALAANRIPGTQVNLGRLGRAGDTSILLDAGLSRWLGDTVSPATRSALIARIGLALPEARLDEPSDEQDMFGDEERAVGGLARGQRVRLQAARGDPQRIHVAALILGSPEFQRQ